jgi:hypothetical protein
MNDQAMESSLFRKLRFTPITDLFRGRLSARLDWAGVIRSSSLPADLKHLVTQLTRRTRLWREERVDVANELIAHFTDGLAAGETESTLVQAFGNERVAARMIRRAKLRNRPLWWQIGRVCRWMMIALLVFYALLSVYFFIGRPTVGVDYLAIINKPILATAESDRAWPLYRRAVLGMDDAAKWREVFNYDMDRKHWPLIKAWLLVHKEQIDLAREGTSKPYLGNILSLSDDPELNPDPKKAVGPFNEGGPLISIRLPLNVTREMAELLTYDSKLAATQGDGTRCVQDISAVIHLANQVHRHDGFLITGLISNSIFWSAVDQTQRILHQDPSVFSDAQLQALAHELAGPKVAADFLNVADERLSMLDIIQRVYTDDGHADGRMTPAGIRLLSMFPSAAVPTEHGAEKALGPVTILVIASRKELQTEYDRGWNAFDSAAHRPLREVDINALEAPAALYRNSRFAVAKYALLGAFAPAMLSPLVRAEKCLGERDGTEVGLALELYRRHHGEYPKDLSALVPSMLPEIPADRITGEPVHYRLVDGKPLIYSVGADRVDDGGQPATIRHSTDLSGAARWRPEEKTIKGDWILYPDVLPTIEDEQ